MKRKKPKFSTFAEARAYYAPDVLKKREIRRMLLSTGGTYTLVWYSVSGPVKTMTVTLDSSIIPLSAQYFTGKQKNQTAKGAVSLRVWSPDANRKDWRQFNVNSIINLTKDKEV